jgi:hypothetical protein
MSVFDHFPDPDPGFRGQKSTGYRIRIRNTALLHVIPVSMTFLKNIVFPVAARISCGGGNFTSSTSTYQQPILYQRQQKKCSHHDH